MAEKTINKLLWCYCVFIETLACPLFLYRYYIYCINITAKIQVKFGFLCIIYNVLKFFG